MLKIVKQKRDNLGLRLRARLELRRVMDWPMASVIYGGLMLVAAAITLSSSKRLGLLLTALRRFENGVGLALTKRSLRPFLEAGRVSIWREHRIGWERFYGDFADIAREPKLNATLLIKEPGPGGEKGVLYSSFEYNWMKIVANHDARAFFREYILVGATSWSPSDYAVFANLCGLSDDPMFLGICNPADMPQYRTFAPDVYPVPIMGCDWEDPGFFRPRPHRDRTIDIVMVSHFAKWKRHWLLFEALKHMPRSLNVVLIGREDSGRTEREIRAEARAFGVRQDLTIYTALEFEEVVKHQCNAKISANLSKREGCCVAVTEALFADTPVVMMNDAHVGPRAYINTRTGEIGKRGELHRTISEMLENSSKYSPRAWACQNIPARLTSERLNTILRDYSLNAGKPWTRDIVPLCWRYVPNYLDSADAQRMQPGIERLRECHGIELEIFISEADARRRHQAALA